MAKFGARYSCWAPFAASAEDNNPTKLPVYDTTVLQLGELNKANESLTFAEGSLPGDDKIVLYDRLFKDGKLDVESVYIANETAGKLFGVSVDEAKGLSFGDDDKPPYGGYGCITHHIGKSESYWQAVFYPKVKALPPTEDSITTRGDNLNFATDKLPFHVELPACRKYKIIKDFSTEAEAMQYIKDLFAGKAKVPGLADPAMRTQTNGGKTPEAGAVSSDPVGKK